MTVGLPGAGVGGIFYLLSALAMPVHAAARHFLHRAGSNAGGELPPRWGLIWKQFATAVGIIAGLWVTGWLLAAYLIANPNALGAMQTAAVGKRLPNVLKIGAVVVSVGTLAGVLFAVQVARLLVRPKGAPERPFSSDSAGRSRNAAGLLFAVLTCLGASRGLEGQSTTGSLESAMAAADHAWSEGDTALARREYEAALAIDPTASRALYRLGELNRSRPRVARKYFVRYTRAERSDAWGWIALGNAYGLERRYSAGLRAYDSASAIAPGERDVVIGRARLLAAAGRIDESIRVHEEWTALHPDDGESWIELGDQRRRAGRYREAARAYASSLEASPTSRARSRLALSRSMTAAWVELHGDGSQDTDEDQTARAGAIGSAQIADRVRVLVGGSRRWISGPLDLGLPDFTVDEAFAGVESRPTAALRIEARAGAAIPRNEEGTDDESAIVTGHVRGKWRQPGGRASLELRAARTLLDVTPVLVFNRVTRTELSGRADLPIVSLVTLRAGARAASYSSTDDENRRTSVLGGLILPVTPSIEIGGVYQRIMFDHESFAGYFTPRTAHLAEVASYAEFESESGVVLAVDAGAGAARFELFGNELGDWEPAYRLMTSLVVPLRDASSIRVELDTYDSRLASDAGTASSWRFLSVTAALRVGFR